MARLRRSVLRLPEGWASGTGETLVIKQKVSRLRLAFDYGFVRDDTETWLTSESGQGK